MTTSSPTPLTRERIHEVLWRLAALETGKDPGQLTADSRLIQDLGADSLGMVELTMQLEEELGITVPEELMEKADLTLGQLEEELSRLPP